MTAGTIALWEGRDAAALAERWGAAAVHPFADVGSTNDVARRLAADGAPDGSVVVADEQTAGRGRAGRAWSSPPGLGLWVSIVRRPGPGFQPGALPLRVGLAAARALDRFLAPARAELKWPNDLHAGGRKVGGILCEAVWEGDRPAAVVVGLGLNVLHGATAFPEELRPLATSVALAAGREPDRAAVADAILPALLALPLSGGLSDDERAAFRSRDAFHGREVEVTDPDSGALRLRGTANGPAADGALLLRLEDGSERAVHSGTLRPAGITSPPSR